MRKIEQPKEDKREPQAEIQCAFAPTPDPRILEVLARMVRDADHAGQPVIEIDMTGEG